jgi:4-amino-4-deoxy-L-arabinose transferase-like glycosyltransferase
MVVAAAGDHILRHRLALSIAFGMILTLLLRAPWHDAALGRDEGGVAMVARDWHSGGPFAFGSLFLDRPPLLVALYKLVGAGQDGIRVLGAIAALLLVLTSTLLAVRLGGRKAAPWAAGIGAVLASTFAIRSVFTPAELLAVVPSSASVLLLLVALERESRRLWLFAGAGALAATALLVKQSFGDALVAGAVAIAAGKLLGLSWRETARRAGAYLAGVLALFVALVIWALATQISAHDVWYAMFGFRIDSVDALVSHGLETRLSTLETPLLGSGLAVAAIFALVGIVRLRDRPLVRITTLAWMLAAGAGILLGGSYWPHYLIALVPVAAAGAATTFRRYPFVGAVATAVIVLPTLFHAAGVARRDSADTYEESAATIGHYLRDRALPGQTAYAMYAKVNAVYYTGLRDPFPYNWSLMVRAVPGAEARLRALLASPGRPTWLIRAQGARSFGLDRSLATRRLLMEHYRHVATVCGTKLLVARGARVLPPAPGEGCHGNTSNPA